MKSASEIQEGESARLKVRLCKKNFNTDTVRSEYHELKLLKLESVSQNEIIVSFNVFFLCQIINQCYVVTARNYNVLKTFFACKNNMATTILILATEEKSRRKCCQSKNTG